MKITMNEAWLKAWQESKVDSETGQEYKLIQQQ